MTENFDSDAHDYLLNQMDAARRLAFEQELERNPDARAALKACADSLAGFACEAADAEPLSASEQRTALAAILGTANATAKEREIRPRPRLIWLQFLWATAALILIALNLVNFERPFAPPSRPSPHPTELARSETAAPPGSKDSKQNPPGRPGVDAKQAPSLPDNNAKAASAADDQRRELERLRANVTDLQWAQARLRAEYDALLARVAKSNPDSRELTRLTTMELVDAASHARGERRGLVNVGRGIITEPGVVVAVDPPTTGSTSVTTRQPYAWSVFDEQEQRGYLNLYQLPTVPAEQSLQVWVRPGDASEYQRVGEVPPQFQGGNGSLQYSLPATTSPPAEILITIEPRATPPNVPSGAVVLRGP